MAREPGAGRREHHHARSDRDQATSEQCKVGFAAGDEFVPYLKWRSLPPGPALRVGLLDAASREFLAGRIVVPDLRSGMSGWIVGRRLGDASAALDAVEEAPKYLGRRGPKTTWCGGLPYAPEDHRDLTPAPPPATLPGSVQRS